MTLSRKRGLGSLKTAARNRVRDQGVVNLSFCEILHYTIITLCKQQGQKHPMEFADKIAKNVKTGESLKRSYKFNSLFYTPFTW